MNTISGTFAEALSGLDAAIRELRPSVDGHITHERVASYLTAIANTPAPSTAATALRTPVLRKLLEADGAQYTNLELDANFANTGSTVILTGKRSAEKPLWYFAHLDTISYLVSTSGGAQHPLIPFCYHLTQEGRRDALCYRFDLLRARYVVVAAGFLDSEAGQAFFRPQESSFEAEPGDRIVPVATCAPCPDGHWTGHFDNAGGVAALAVAAPVLARAGIDAMVAFPDEEEGPNGSGNQIMSRGSSRVIDRLASPDLAVVVDMQQAGSSRAPGAVGSGVELGRGAVLSEYSSLGRGAVTPPHIVALSSHLTGLLGAHGVNVQKPKGDYTSRSDDVSVMLKTPNIVLLGFPGENRHFDTGLPKANLDDIVHLSKALVYMALLQPLARVVSRTFGSVG